MINKLRILASVLSTIGLLGLGFCLGVSWFLLPLYIEIPFIVATICMLASVVILESMVKGYTKLYYDLQRRLQ